MNADNKALKRMLYAVIISASLLVLSFLLNSLFKFDRYGLLRVLPMMALVVSSIGLIVLWLINKFSRASPPPKRNIEHGSAQWATEQQFINAGNPFYQPGLWIGNGFTRSKSGHLITIAGSGAGKNACLIIPNLLVNPFGSYVVTDPKGENACITARSQRECGQRVFILDPWNQQERMGAKHGIPASGFNPFDFIKSDPAELRDNCELVANYLVPENPQAKEPYWEERARTLIRTCLMHIVTDLPAEQHNFWTLYKMIRVSGDAWLGLLADMKLNKACDELISIAAEEFIGMDPMGATLTGIRSNAQNATTIFESPQLRQSLEKSDFNPYELSNGNCTVYIVIPERYLETHSAWLRLVVGLCLKAVNSKPNKRVNFLLDEFAVMGKMKDVQKAYAFSRGQNIVMWAFAQSLSQLKEIYGEDGMNTLISNAAMFQAFGIKDQYTKEYVSKWLGESTQVKRSNSTSSDGKYSSTSVSYQSYGRSLLTSEEVEKINDIIVFTEGLKFLIYRIGYYQNRYEGIHWKSEGLLPEVRKILKSGKLPNDLREYFAQRADPPPRILV